MAGVTRMNRTDEQQQGCCCNNISWYSGRMQKKTGGCSEYIFNRDGMYARRRILSIGANKQKHKKSSGTESQSGTLWN